MVRAIGIHLEQEFIVAAAADNGIGRIEIGSVEFIAGTTIEERLRKLKDFVDRAGRAERIAVSLPAHRAMLRKFHVPFARDEEISQIITYESEKYITAYPVEQLVVDYHILRREKQGARLLVAAMSRETIGHALSLAEEQGLMPMVLELDLMALLHTARTIGLAPDGNALLLELHSKACNMLLLEHGEIREARAVPLKIESLFEGVLADLSETAELNLKEAPDQLTAQGKDKVLHRALKEIGKMLLSAPADTPVYCCGQPGLVESLPDLLLRHCEVTAHPWPGLPAASLPYAPVAVGLAVKALSDTHDGFNFRKDEFQYRGSFALVKRPLALALTFVFALLLLAALSARKPLLHKRQEYEQLIACAQKVYAHIAPDSSWDSIGYWDKIDVLGETVRARMQPEENVPIRDAFATWQAIFVRIAPVRKEYHFTVENIAIGQEDAVLEGRAESMLCFDLWQRALRDLPEIKPGENSLGVQYSHEVESPPNERLTWEYKFLIRLGK